MSIPERSRDNDNLKLRRREIVFRVRITVGVIVMNCYK